MTENYSNPIIRKGGPVTLIGDAAPYESIQRTRSKSSTIRCAGSSDNKECRPLSKWRDWSAKSVLTEFESEMLAHSAIKVKHSAEAAVLTF
jgi:hypothetical protein